MIWLEETTSNFNLAKNLANMKVLSNIYITINIIRNIAWEYKILKNNKFCFNHFLFVGSANVIGA